MSPFLYRGITFASLSFVGKMLVLMTLLVNNARGSEIMYLISFNILLDIWSWPELVFVGNLFITFRISFAFVFCRLNFEVVGVRR